LYNLSGELTVILVVSKLSEGFPVIKDEAKNFDVEIFIRRKWWLGTI
jgi:hypothetical protein